MNYNDVEKFAFVYDYSNRLARVTNNAENYTTDYTYDLSGRLIEKNRSDGAYVKTSYNEKNLATGVSFSFGGVTENISYEYDETKDNALRHTNFSSAKSNSYIAYDALGKISKEFVISNAFRTINEVKYTYVNRAGDSTKTTGLVSGLNYTADNLADITYTYDGVGNIKTVTYSNGVTESYSYDSLNRLVTANIGNDTYRYTYDNSGNILSKTKNNSTTTYSYETGAWKDRLASYGSSTISYDPIGNPLSYGNVTFTWNGRRMATFSNGTTTTSYKYNEDGVRTSKTVGSTKTEFFVDGTTILAQKTGNNTIPFYYDANGKRIAFKYDDNMYYYVYNLQGDVTHIINAYGDIVGTYEYDAWGKITNLSSLTAIAQVNPFRYRGYYYDNESGLYYLNSRYYNAEWGRFINADSYVTTGQGLTSYNLFVYCGNNPIINIDPNGTCPYNGTAADFRMLEQGLHSLNCTCELTNGISIGLTIFDNLCSISVAGATDLAKHTNNTSVRPNNIGAGTHAKMVTKTNASIDAFTNGYNTFSDILSVGQIIFNTANDFIYNCSTGASVDVIIWDAAVDVGCGAVGYIVAKKTTIAVGAAVGSAIPIPVVGPVIGVAAGIAVSYAFDIAADKLKAIYR